VEDYKDKNITKRRGEKRGKRREEYMRTGRVRMKCGEKEKIEMKEEEEECVRAPED
jgi:hypothetical protein